MTRLKKTAVITQAAMLSGAAIVLGFFKIPINPIIEIRFGSFPVKIAGHLNGPMIGAIVGIISDIGGYIIKPTGPFFIGFTISSMVTGLIFGFCLNVDKPSTRRIFIAEVLNTLIVGMVLNSLWLSILYGKGIIAVILSRLIKEIVMLPINTAILVVLINAFSQFKKTRS